MKFTDMDMLQDYEKDARMAVIAYSLIQTEIFDEALRSLLQLRQVRQRNLKKYLRT